MDAENISVILSVIATTLAVASFCGAAWRIWRDRPRLYLYVAKTTFKNLPGGNEVTMLQIKVCNIGFRPIILTRCAALGTKSAYVMGIHDNPATVYGIQDQRFPSILKPGDTLTFHPMSIDSLERNATDPKDPKVFFDPYRYIVIEDSFGRFHHMRMEDIRWNLHMDKQWSPMKWRQKIAEYFQRRILFHRAKRQHLKA
ncbi:MAG: hypothetical protein HYW28_08535 [Rhodospirillales bacterium]|nr:hypothetical protein [Rhodospirillales bacterium]